MNIIILDSFAIFFFTKTIYLILALFFTDIMSNFKIESNSMVGKVIAVLIALLFVTVLAFPIANSLGNMGKDDDGGGTGPITYTNSGEFYYKSATADNSLHTFEYLHKEHLINEDDWEWIESYEIDGVEVLRYSPDSSEIDKPRIFIGWTDTTQFWIDPGNAMLCYGPDSISNVLNVEFTDLVETETSYEFKLSLSIQNGTMSYVDMNTHQTQTVPINYYLSSEEQGDYVLSETPIVAENTDIYVAKDGYAPETNNQGRTAHYTLGGKINSSELTQDTVIVQGVGYYGITYYQEGTLDCEMNSIKGDNILTLSSMEINGSFTIRYNNNTNNYFEFTESITQFLVPSTVTVEEEGGDSGSGSDGLGNVASTLVKLVPILLIVGILLIFVMPMINKSN